MSKTQFPFDLANSAPIKRSQQGGAIPRLLVAGATLAAALMLGGCASTSEKGETGQAKGPAAEPGTATKFQATDGRTISIGKPTPADGGLRYANPHTEKGKCWVADGFNFTGFDTIYLAPTLSTATFPDKAADIMVHDIAKARLVTELAALIETRKLFTNVATKEADIKPGAKVLKLENTITEFSKGGGGARYFVGLYGGGQPVLRVQGRAVSGEKALFTYEARRSGVSGGARMGGAFMKDEDIQIEDIRSLALDLTDFMAAVSGKYPAKN